VSGERGWPHRCTSCSTALQRVRHSLESRSWSGGPGLSASSSGAASRCGSDHRTMRLFLSRSQNAGTRICRAAFCRRCAVRSLDVVSPRLRTAHSRHRMMSVRVGFLWESDPGSSSGQRSHRASSGSAAKAGGAGELDPSLILPPLALSLMAVALESRAVRVPLRSLVGRLGGYRAGGYLSLSCRANGRCGRSLQRIHQLAPVVPHIPHRRIDLPELERRL
jgi:hypothetical protein